MIKGYYKCECGKEFDNPQKFNGHKKHCRIHLEEVGKLETIEKSEELQRLKIIDTWSRKNENLNKIKEDLAKEQLSIWISEQHTCEKCGKIMTEKFGSGRFCSRVCANSRAHSDRTKEKISNSIKKTFATSDAVVKHLQKFSAYYRNRYYSSPRRCCVCDTIIPFELKNRSTCSKECLAIFYQEHAKNNNLGGVQTITSWGKRGKYRGIHCDSRFELAFLICCIDDDIKIERASSPFVYEYNECKHNYYPDFYLSESDTYVELKGYDSNKEITLAKLNSVLSSGHNVKILYEDDLVPYFKRIEEVYGIPYNKLENMYDK